MIPRSHAWGDLVQAITLLSNHRTDEISPFHCEHDQLFVMADDTKFTADQLAQLEEWGFEVDTENGGFYSFRYGSA
jgi:hypothetical protein